MGTIKGLLAGIELVLTSGVQYTLVLLTRFDLVFRLPVYPRIRLDALNVVTTFVPDEHTFNITMVDDNLHVMPLGFLRAFRDIIEEMAPTAWSWECLLSAFEERFPVHLMFNEPERHVSQLTFFRLHRVFNSKFGTAQPTTRRSTFPLSSPPVL